MTILFSNYSIKHSLSIVLSGLLLLGCEQGTPPDETWEYAAKGLYSAAIADNGKQLAIGSIYHGGSLWDAANGERLFNWNHKEGQFSNIIAIGFSPEGYYALTADHQTMVLWDTRTGAASTFWTSPSEVLAIDLSDNGNYALLGLGDYSAVLFDVKRGGIQRTFHHQDRVTAVALSNDGRYALTGSEDSTAKLWDIQTGKLLHQFNHEDEVVTVALSNTGDKAFTVAKYDKAALWHTEDGKMLGSLPLQLTAVKRGQSFISARFSPNDKLLLTGNSDRQVQLWSVKSLKERAHWTIPKRDPWKPTGAAVIDVSFTNKAGHYLAIGSNGLIHRLKRPRATKKP